MTDRDDKLIGRHEIASFMGWSMSKLNRKLPELWKARVIFEDTKGRPPVKVICSFKTSLRQYCLNKS